MVSPNVNFPQIDLQIQCNPYQHLSSLFVETDKLTLKFTWECKEPKIEFEGLTVPDFKFYYKATVINKVCVCGGGGLPWWCSG